MNVWNNYKVHHPFVTYRDRKKDPNSPFAELQTIDTGLDATNAIITFQKSINKDPIQCISMELDSDGTNMGPFKGVKGRNYSTFYLSTLSAA